MLTFRRLLKRFWATVCKTVRPPPIGPLSRLSVTLVYCGQTVEWIKMPVGTEVGLGSGHIVLDGDPVAPRKGTQQPLPTFRPTALARSPISATVELLFFFLFQQYPNII